MKKVLVLLAMVLGATNMYAFEVDGLFYNITSEGDMTVEVIRKPNYGYYQGDIVIPETIRYNNKTYKVTAVADRAFFNCLDLTSITIPKTIKTVGKYVFQDCNKLKSVTINCKTVGAWFSKKGSIKTLILGNGVETIGNYAFDECCGITSLSISNTVKSIGEYAFMDCNRLTSVTIPGSVKVVGEGAFSYCLNLEQLNLSKGLVKIEGYAFANCRQLKKVTIPQSVTFIGSNAFKLCLGLREINIPASLPKMNYNGAFDNSKIDYIHVYQNERDLLEYVEESHETGAVTDVADKVDTMPLFVGGKEGLVRWLSDNLIYPKKALEYGIMGTVVVSFVVEVDGTLRDIKVIKHCDPTFDKEALRLAHLMPKWIPATLNGRSVAVRINFPFNFKLVEVE